jgi:peptidylprolyl isomerase
MASSGKDTEGSQFFVTQSPQPHLDGRYTIFGQVTGGQDVVDRLQIGDRLQGARVAMPPE